MTKSAPSIKLKFQKITFSLVYLFLRNYSIMSSKILPSEEIKQGSGKWKLVECLIRLFAVTVRNFRLIIRIFNWLCRIKSICSVLTVQIIYISPNVRFNLSKQVPLKLFKIFHHFHQVKFH